ncbi:SAM-dependent methyltransferase [Actinoplanes flavus]|uniref:Methyltransferase domain-containing protein n=1 Tax=Actinoplanes flavus TaxID=2820290 RepID=A0ABS3UH72_9ACTN|nr:methyltransferase domain-containing protein [Actinoplanes flavus]MBO3738119.1 methyltransferase domain-containing protein [Actinoplanes flavus]
MTDPRGIRGWLTGHVEAAVWAASTTGHDPFATAAAEAAAVLGHRSVPPDAGSPALASWDELRSGRVDWARLLAHDLDHPARRHIGAAALLHGAADGLFDRFLAPDAAGVSALSAVGWTSEATRAFESFGMAMGWFVRRDGRLYSDEIRALAGHGTIRASRQWLRRRLRFELDWFWSPIGRLGSAVQTGEAPAVFAASSGAGPFRGASAEMNLPAAPLRAPLAEAVAGMLGLGDRGVRILELGTGTAVWSRAFAGHPDSVVTTVDHPEVGAVVAPVVEERFAGRYTWVAADPSTVPGGCFDVVVVPDLLHTLAPDAVPGFLGSAAAVLAPGGVLVIADPLVNRARNAPPGHLLMQVKLAVTGGGRVWDVTALRTALLEAGLSPQRPRTVGGTQIMAAPRR